MPIKTAAASLSGLVLALATPLAPAWATGDAERGRALSQQHCTRCHVVGDFNPHGGIGSTPSFQMMVKNLADYRERFETFFARRPHPAFIVIEGSERLTPDIPSNIVPIALPQAAIADIQAFAETLRKKD